eukprot:3862812-Prorocentrum_lima.AAC.1
MTCAELRSRGKQKSAFRSHLRVVVGWCAVGDVGGLVEAGVEGSGWGLALPLPLVTALPLL